MNAEFSQPGLGGATSRVEGANGAATATRAGDDVVAEGALVECRPVESRALGVWLRLRHWRCGGHQWWWRWLGDDAAEASVRGVDAVKRGEVPVGRGHQHHQALDQLLGGEGEADSLIWMDLQVIILVRKYR